MQAEYTAFYKRGASLVLMAINDQPTQLAVFIGGFMGESFALRLQEGVLLYEAYGDQYELRLAKPSSPPIMLGCNSKPHWTKLLSHPGKRNMLILNALMERIGQSRLSTLT